MSVMRRIADSSRTCRHFRSQSSFLVHSLRGILKLPPQHLQPALCAAVAENCDGLARVAAACVESAGKHNTARGNSAPQSGQGTGKSYSASGRNSENGPQREQSYSYFGMSFLALCADAKTTPSGRLR